MSATAITLDATHDAATQSWVKSANAADTDFPIQNLPFGRFRHNRLEPWQIGVAIGDRVLDLHATGLIDHNDMARLMAAPVDAKGGVLDVKKGERLFGPMTGNYDVSANGQRFLTTVPVAGETAPQLTVVQNWTSGIKSGK